MELELEVVAIQVPHPEKCDAAQCTVPSFSDVVISVPVDARGGQRFHQRVCLGHYYAFKTIISQLAHRGIPASIFTAAEIAEARSRMRAQSFVNMRVGGFTMTNGSSYTTTTSTPWGF